MYDIIIIGGGMAGLTSAIYARRFGLKTTVIEKELWGGMLCLTDIIENWPGERSIKGCELGEKLKTHAEYIGVELRHGEVVGVKVNQDVEIELANKEKIKARTLVIATGSRPKRLNIPGEEELRGRGVSYCAICDGPFFKGRNVVVIGGGNSALTNALYLTNIAAKVYVVHRRKQFRAEKALEQQLRKKRNVEFILEKEPVRFEGTGKLKEIVLTGGKRIMADGAFVSVGEKPNSEIFAGIVEIDEKGYIKTDEQMRTNKQNVFASGDVRSFPVKQLTTAASDGTTAAISAYKFITGS